MSFSRNEIIEFTRLLRTSVAPMWGRIRKLLTDRGVDVNASVLAESFPDDVCFQFGVLITQDGKVIQYGYDYLHKEISQGEFTEWNDITSRYDDTPYGESVKSALKLKEAKEI